MKKNPISKGVIADSAAGIGPVTAGMVRKRARELALIAGRGPSHVSLADYDQAKRELAGESEIDPREALLESLPESERDPLPASAGHHAQDMANEDEDEDGRSEAEQLVEEGARQAEHEQMLEAAREAERHPDRL